MSIPAKKTPNRPADATAAAVATTPLEHRRIARLAYSYWEARGRPDGSAEEDWFRAEDELRQKKAAWTLAKKRAKPREASLVRSRRRKSAV
jgi:hypothetical protein